VTSARIVSDAFFFDFNHATCDGVKNTATRSVFFSFAAAIGTSQPILCTREKEDQPLHLAKAQTGVSVPHWLPSLTASAVWQDLMWHRHSCLCR